MTLGFLKGKCDLLLTLVVSPHPASSSDSFCLSLTFANFALPISRRQGHEALSHRGSTVNGLLGVYRKWSAPNSRDAELVGGTTAQTVWLCSGRKCPYGCSAASFRIWGIRSTIRSCPTQFG